MRNKLLSCLRYNLKKLLASPVTYLVIVLTILFVDREILPVRNYLRDTGTLVSWPGLLTYLLDYAPLTLLMGLAIIALLSPLPMTDEAQVYIMVRSGRKSWARAQVAMIFVVSVAYMILVSLAVLLWISPYVDWSGGWSDGILAFVEGGAYETYDSLLSYDPWVMRTYAPWAAALMELIYQHYPERRDDLEFRIALTFRIYGGYYAFAENRRYGEEQVIAAIGRLSNGSST